MNELQRIIMRLIGVIAIGAGIVGLVHPFKTYQEDSLYHVTTYSRQTGRTIAERDQAGADLMTGQLWGAVAVIACGAFCLFGSRKENK